MSGALASLFLSGQNPTIAITDQTIGYASPAVCTVAYQLNTDGSAYAGRGASSPAYTFIEVWDSIVSTVGSYEVFAALAGDPLTSGPVGAWTSLGSTQTWTLSTPLNFVSSTLSMSIRHIGTTTVLASATITLTAQAF